LRFYFVLGRNCPIVVPATICQIEGSPYICSRQSLSKKSSPVLGSSWSSWRRRSTRTGRRSRSAEILGL